MTLTVTSSGPTALTATLPAGLSPGTYHLFVATNGDIKDKGHLATMDVTLGAAGPAGSPGPARSPGPQYVANGLLSPSGEFVVINKSPGTDVTVSRIEPGHYRMSGSGFGTDCPVPMFGSFGSSATIYWENGGCGPGTFTDIDVFTSDGQDHYFTFSIVAAH
jgi:hypothetical protein